MPIDRERLAKFLELTRSDNEHEALAAMRQANKLVPDWGAFVRGTEARSKLGVAYREKPAQPIRRETYRPLISEMLQECLENVRGEALDFIQDLSHAYESRGFLTPKQNAALTKFYDNL
jgi:hypothetical protein